MRVTISKHDRGRSIVTKGWHEFYIDKYLSMFYGLSNLKVSYNKLTIFNVGTQVLRT